MRDFRKLKVWEKAHLLQNVNEIKKMLNSFTQQLTANR